LLTPYGEIGVVGPSSRLAVPLTPYTLDEEAYTSLGTPWRRHEVTRRSVATMFAAA
jgi:hypothetical protein